MKTATLKLYERRLTPSGMWDNGVWDRTERKVHIPLTVLRGAVVTEVRLFRGKDGTGRPVYHERAWRITVVGSDWLVQEDPAKHLK